jgi:hypothetical protein
VCFALALVATARVWTSPETSYAGYPGDPEQSMWFLRWTPYALTHGINPLSTAHIGFPQGTNLMWNTAMVALGIVLWPITVTAGPVVAYDVAVLLALALSGVAAYAVLRRLVGPGLPALAGALLFELSPYAAAHVLGQLNLTVAVTPPLVLLLLDAIVRRRRMRAWKPGVLLGLLAALQLMTSEEMLASAAVAGAVLLGVMLACQPDRRAALRMSLPRLGGGLGAALCVALPLVAVPLLTQFFGAQRIHGPLQQPGTFVSDLLNLVVPTRAQLVAPGAATDISQRFSGNLVEWSAYIGVPLLALLAVTARRHWQDGTVRVAAVTGAVTLVLSFGPWLHVAGVDTHIPMPFLLLQHVPLLGDMLPGRLTVYVFLAAAVLLAVAVRDAATPRAKLLVAVCAATVLPAVPLPAQHVDVPAFFTSASAASLPTGGSVLVAPYVSSFAESQVMLWQAQAGMSFRMPEGYAMMPAAGGTAHLGPAPTALSRAMQAIAGGNRTAAPLPTLSRDTRSALQADLRAWDVRAVIVGPMDGGHDAMVALFTDLLGCAPSQQGGVDLWPSVHGGSCAG